MTVQILKHGEKPEDRIYITQCRTCHTDFQFQPTDAVYMTDQRDGDAYKIACPCCTWTCWVGVDTYEKQSAHG